MAREDILDRIRTTRSQRRELDDQLRALVNEAFESGYTWRQIAEAAGVGRARIYQIKDGTR